MAAGYNAKLLFFGFITLAVVLEVGADILFKKWVLDNRTAMLAGGLLFYTFGTVFWALSLRQELLSRAVTVFTVLNLVAVVLVGTLVFGEKLTFANKVGIALGVAGIIMMEI